MPSLNLNFLNILQDDYKKYQNFIETGTFMGETIFRLEPYFDKLYTIEIKKEFYENVKKKYSGDKLSFFLGDSPDVLNELLPDIIGKSIIFLDGHWSAGNTGHGKKEVPLYEELNNIILHHKDEAIIIIDDVRLFEKREPKYYDWSDINIENILKIVKDRQTKGYFLPSCLAVNDRFIIHICKHS